MSTIKRKIFFRTSYTILTYITYLVLLEFFSYKIKYLIHIIFAIHLFLEYIFEQLDFYEKRFRYKDVFITGLINIIFAILLFIISKRLNIFIITGVLIFEELLFRKIICDRYVKMQNVVIFGSDHIQNNVQERLIKSLDYNYVGYVSNNRSKRTKYHIGEYSELERIIKEKKVDVLVIVKDMKNEDFKNYFKVIFDLKIKGLKILTYNDFTEEIERKVSLLKVDEEWLVRSDGFDILNNQIHKNVKRGLDIFLSIVLLIITSPIFLISSVIIMLESKGSIIFKQKRIGINLNEFNVYKFRSMYVHDAKKHSKYACDNDSRITKYGKIMRKTRIDELPQLWNVLKGDMSFVGPRPEWCVLAKEYREQIPYYDLRHLIRPGITGWAQVMYPYGENIEDAKRKLEYDLYYIKKQDLILDVLVILKTARVILLGLGK